MVKNEVWNRGKQSISREKETQDVAFSGMSNGRNEEFGGDYIKIIEMREFLVTTGVLLLHSSYISFRGLPEPFPEPAD
jgi:hypothetical protein